METKAFCFRAGSCWIGLGYTDKGLRRVYLSTVGPEEVEASLVHSLGREIAFGKPEQGSLLESLPAKLAQYFAGVRVQFDEPVDLRGMTDFQQQVLAATREIPYGQTRSYSWVAQRVGNPRAFRAVGQALGRNPVAIVVPCHRVVTSQGAVGGFGWGVEMKKLLLSIESRAAM